MIGLNNENQRTETDTIRKIAKSDSTIISPQCLAWCSKSIEKGQISLYNMENRKIYSTFDAVKLKTSPWQCNLVSHSVIKKLESTNLLVSLGYDTGRTRPASFEIFDVLSKGRKTIFSFEEIKDVGSDSIAFNSKRGMMITLPVYSKIAYHIFRIGSEISLLRKSKWPRKQKKEYTANPITGMDFESEGVRVATINGFGRCIVWDINTNVPTLISPSLAQFAENYSTCRWSSKAGDPILWAKVRNIYLNMIDVEKQTILLKSNFTLGNPYGDYIYSIEVCPSNHNLLAAGGYDYKVMIYDRRINKIVTQFGNELHCGTVYCVQWSPDGELLASASADTTAKVTNLKTRTVLHSVATVDKKEASSVCFI